MIRPDTTVRVFSISLIAKTIIYTGFTSSQTDSVYLFFKKNLTQTSFDIVREGEKIVIQTTFRFLLSTNIRSL